MAFSPRTTSYGIYGDPKWYSDNPYYPRYQMPNCTAYAWGRFWEIIGRRPDGLPNADGGKWWDRVQNFTKSQTPALGAVVCWYDPNAGTDLLGHVAIVEEIWTDSNNNIVCRVSESGWLDDSYLTSVTGVNCNRRNGILPRIVSDTSIVTWYWRNSQIITSADNYHLSRRPTYVCQGFILPDNTTGIVPPTEWVHRETDDYPNFTEAENQNNVVMIYLNLRGHGWSLEAIAGVIGNMVKEGILNPGQCELGRGLPQYDLTTGVATNLYFLPDQSHNYGLGLCGWTQGPNAVLTESMTLNRAWYDGDLQCDLLDRADTMGFWIPTTTWTDTWQQFKSNTYGRSVEDLASEFLYNYERPADPTASENERRTWARYWYNYLLNVDTGFGPPLVPNENALKKMPIWMMIRYH